MLEQFHESCAAWWGSMITVDVTLRTLKSKSIQEQVRAVNDLAKQNLDLYDAIESLFTARSEDSMFQFVVSGDRHRVVCAALLAVVAADITIVPHEPARQRHQNRLKEVCKHLSIDYNDIRIILPWVARIGEILGR